MVVLGWILIIVGLIALLAGVVGGIMTMFQKIQKDASRGDAGIESLPVKWMEALIKFIEALTNAPMWLALCIIGILLIGWGSTIT